MNSQQRPTEIDGMPVIERYGELYAIPIIEERCDCKKCKSLIPISDKPLKITLITEQERMLAMLGKYL